MWGERFDREGDEPIYAIDMGSGYGVISQLNENGEVESICCDASRLRAMADLLEASSKNTDRQLAV